MQTLGISETLKSTFHVEKANKELHRQGRWEKRHSVVTRALRTSSFLLAASTESSGKVSFEARGSFKAHDVIDLGDAALGFVAGAHSSAIITMIGKGGDAVATILVGLTHLKGLFSTPGEHTLSVDRGDLPGAVFEDLGTLTEFTPDIAYD